MITLFKKIPLIKSFSAYTFFNLLNSGIPIILLPILTNYLSPSGYGVLSNINALFLFVVPFVGINITAAVSRQYVKKEVDLSQYVGNAFFIIILAGTIVQLLLILFRTQIESLIHVPVEYILVIAVYAMFHNLIELLLGIYRMEDNVSYFGVFKVLRSIVEIGISLILIVVLNLEWEGRFYAIFITTTVFGILSLFFLKRKRLISFKKNIAYRKHFLKFGMPLIIHAQSAVIILYSDKLMITNFFGLRENGIYTVAFQIGMIISLFQNSFNQAWTPWLYKKLTLNKKEDKLTIVKITYLYFGAILLLVFLLWLGTPLIFKIIGKQFITGSSMVVIVGLGFAFNGMYKMVVNYIFFIEKTHLISIITLIMSFLNVIFNIIFLEKYGVIGAAYSSSLTFFIQFITVWLLAGCLYNMPWNLKK